MSSILLVEDDLSLIYGLEYSIQKNGFSVDVARTVEEALQIYKEKNYDLLLLDVSLPDGDGFDICKRVREASNVPIIFLTASDEEVNVVMGLDMGGDDYITKPFKLNELISRIKALLRRYNFTSENVTELKSNNITVKLLENRVFKNEIELELTTAEYKLLCLLMKNKNIVLTRKNILDKLWDGNGSFVDDNTLSVYVRRLRNKIEDNPENPKNLLTVRRMGYKWNVIK
ncbi:TPA: response regulator transcription factor [Clostridioides difficile]|uniref:Two component transcriptional regulator, winged helix family n=3 Tax=Clostridioides difficile TaxID=1496 RepID=A0AC59FUZ9_CLODI|nr:response regulator transcription factor [Clostridioides difficile]EQE83513.1 transcriptional regulatory family protein [Clostridioides difficile CD68]EQF84910.1 transcriptional regulatory family protein [Clostridioides difficile 342]EQH85832.1 transcriptional regulatory family protein [Clostridioides difficile DA00307]EQJ26645.1 transcriptional regulatory family protein [Clostridioides difficile P15]AKP41180.1 two component transcriptional regulator, winged helix family [Clostridioides diff